MFIVNWAHYGYIRTPDLPIYFVMTVSHPPMCNSKWRSAPFDFFSRLSRFHPRCIPPYHAMTDNFPLNDSLTHRAVILSRLRIPLPPLRLSTPSSPPQRRRIIILLPLLPLPGPRRHRLPLLPLR